MKFVLIATTMKVYLMLLDVVSRMRQFQALDLEAATVRLVYMSMGIISDTLTLEINLRIYE